jgi:hypothetical protein
MGGAYSTHWEIVRGDMHTKFLGGISEGKRWLRVTKRRPVYENSMKRTVRKWGVEWIKMAQDMD